ncbi:MAG TPA: RNA-binding protein [Phycisphaerales bacterium]|nr:RNA-binding protein [Phycisphaerales bacterium]
MKIYVGNLNFQTSEDALRTAFSAHGAVDEVSIVSDRETGRSRGFAFVTMPNDQEAQNAINAINGTQLDGRTLNINEAKPKPAGMGGGRGGFGGGGGGGRGGFRRDR